MWKIGGVESAAIVFATLAASEIVLRAIPTFASLDVMIATRLVLLGLLDLALGYWLRSRYQLRLSQAALPFALGVGASFVLRGIREAQEGYVQNESVEFLIGIAAVEWGLLLAGAAVGRSLAAHRAAALRTES